MRCDNIRVEKITESHRADEPFVHAMVSILLARREINAPEISLMLTESDDNSVTTP
jgi:hypothetical protein